MQGRFGVLNSFLLGKRQRIVLETLKQKFEGTLCVLLCLCAVESRNKFCLTCNGFLDWVPVLGMKGSSAGAVELLSVAVIVALHIIME